MHTFTKVVITRGWNKEIREDAGIAVLGWHRLSYGRMFAASSRKLTKPGDWIVIKDEIRCILTTKERCIRQERRFSWWLRELILHPPYKSMELRSGTCVRKFDLETMI